MTANELRIGNWLLSAKTGEPFQVDSIPNDSEITAQPIVLSPDILEKCGFRKTQEGNMALPEVWSRNYQKRVVINTIDISIRGSDEIYWIEGNTIVELYSLHQLQNLIHALTGEELSINL